MPNTIVLPDHEAVSRHAADRLRSHIGECPNALFCLAAGNTPLRAYAMLAEEARSSPRAFERLRIIKLDEWGGLAMDDPATCEQHLRNALIRPAGLHERYIGFDSHPDDPTSECHRIRDWLELHGPIDACVLGLGVNGHVGFNEPAAVLQSHSHVAQLSRASLAHATLACGRGTPAYGMTLGMADILHASHVLLLVSGMSKRAPLRRMLRGGITTEFPASLLLLHPRLLVICDEESYPSND